MRNDANKKNGLTEVDIRNYQVPVGDSYRVGRSRFLGFTIIFGFVILSLIYMISGFSVYFVLDLALWFYFYRYSRNTVIEGSFQFARTTFIFFIVFLASFAVFGLTAPKTLSKARGSLGSYNNEVLSIYSACGRVRGSIGIRAGYDESSNQDLLLAYYNILITDDLKPNGHCGPESALFGCDKNVTYDYAADLIAVNEGSGIAEGALVPVFCNKNILPKDPFIEIPKEHSVNNCKVVGLNENTDTFILQFIKAYTSYSELLHSNKLAIHNGSFFWEESGGGNDSVDMIMNLDRAVAEGWKVANYDLIIK